MPFYVSDYLADTWHLNATEHGAYCLILFTYWKAQTGPENDEETLALITRLTPAKWNHIKHKILPFFKIEIDGLLEKYNPDKNQIGRLWNKRIEKELNYIKTNKHSGHLGGIASGKARSKTPSESEANGEANSEANREAKPQANAKELELELELKKKKTSKKKKNKTAAPAEFEITAEMKKWAEPLGFSTIALVGQTEIFLDWHRARGNKFVNWNAAWRNWIKKAKQFLDAEK